MNNLLNYRVIEKCKVPIFLCTIFGFLLFFYAPLVLRGQCFYSSDQQFYFEPFSTFLGQSLRHWQLPLWNPYLHCGMPQIAVSSPGIFYPPNLLFAIFSYGRTSGYLMIFHQLLTLIGAYLLIKNLGWGNISAVCGALTCSFSGYMFSLTANYTLIETASWLPINLLLIRLIKQASNRSHLYYLAVLLSLTTFMLITAGRPEISLAVTTIMVAFVFLSSWPGSADNYLSKNPFWPLFAIGVGIALSMPLILPVCEWTMLSPRAKGMDLKYVFLWSANWYDLMSIIFAQPFGDLQKLGSPYLRLAASRSSHIPYLPSPLIGSVAFTLAIWGFSDRKWHGRKWVLTLLCLSLIFILGVNSYIIPKLLAFVPFANLFRYPIKVMIIPIYCLALAAARGMLNFINQSVNRKSFYATIILWGISLVIGLTFLLAGISHKPLPLWELSKYPHAQVLLGRSIILGALLGIVTLLFYRLVLCFQNNGSTVGARCTRPRADAIRLYGIRYWVGMYIQNFAIKILAQKHKFNPVLFALVVNALLLANLYIPALCFRSHTVNRNYYKHIPQLLLQIKEAERADAIHPYGSIPSRRLLSLYFEPVKMPKDYSYLANSSSSSDTLSYFQYCRDLLIPNTNMDWQQPETFGYEASETADFRNCVLDVIHKANSGEESDYYPLWKFCRASSTRWLATQIFNDQGQIPKLDPQMFKLTKENQKMNFRLYSLIDPVPRTYICKTWSWAADHQKIVQKITNSNFRFDPAQQAFIERLPSNDSSFTALLPDGYSLIAKGINQHSIKTKLDSAVFTQSGYIYSAKQLTNSVPSQAPILLKDEPEHISLSANLKKAGFLVLADQFYPGWSAHVDGLLAPIFRTNGLFRGVYLPAGGHLVQFDYEPQSLFYGFLFAGIALGIILCLVLLASKNLIWTTLKNMAGQT